MSTPKPSEDPRFGKAMETLGTFPHCDFQVLHSPGSCSYCDACPIWQALRIVYGINFTGEDDPQKSPCPSARHRPAYQVHRWPGNRPTNAEVPVNPPTSWEHLEGDSDLDD